MSYQAVKKYGETLNTYLLSKKCQSDKATYRTIPTTCHYGKDKTMETVKEISDW